MNTKLEHIQNWAERAREAGWSVAQLARLCGVSKDTLRRHFLISEGKTSSQWLAEDRQRHAMVLLREGCSIKEAATCLGYKQQTNFTRKFKEHWGVCPRMARSTPV